MPVAKKFKDYYDRGCAELLAGKIAESRWSISTGAFDRDRFKSEIAGEIESAGDPAFTARQDIFAAALERHLPEEYAASLEVLAGILGPPLPEAEGMFTHGWWLWPVGRFVQRNALRDTAASMSFIYQLTRRFTGEFAIRPILGAQPVETLVRLREWAQDPDVHVRRLASEGMRISLPWASKCTVALEHFDSFRAVLDLLRAAPERFVQKSVGNNLNDLMKIDPDKAWTIIRDWEARLETASPGDDDGLATDAVAHDKATRWIIRHGTRSLRKK